MTERLGKRGLLSVTGGISTIIGDYLPQTYFNGTLQTNLVEAIISVTTPDVDAVAAIPVDFPATTGGLPIFESIIPESACIRGVDNAHLFNFYDPVLSVDKLTITIDIAVQRFTSGAGPVLQSTTFGPPFVDSPVYLRILGTKYI